MTVRASILICGKIRSREVFRKDMETYRIWKASGQIDRIVYSGWTSDLGVNDDIFSDLREMGVEIVLTPEPNFIVHGYIYHQMKTLHFGLAMFGDDEIVIKSRTDNAWLNFDPITVTQYVAEAEPVGPRSPFAARVSILCGLAFQPYFFNDMMYAGRASDLKRMVSFDLWYDAESALVNAEQALHTAPVIGQRPFLRDYLMVNPGLLHGESPLAGRLQRVLLTDPFYLRCVWDSLTTLRDGYRIGFHPRDPWTPPEGQVTLEDLADGAAGDPVKDLRFLAAANTLEFYSNAAVDFLLTTPISAAEPRSLSALFDSQPQSPPRQEPLFSGPAATLAKTLADAFTELGLLQPPAQNGFVIHQPRMPYVRVL